jgi:hypothetical protein
VVNCSKTIWVLATNAFDRIIHEFCNKHGDDLFDDRASKEADKEIRRLGRQLSRKIQKESLGVFGVSEIALPCLWSTIPSPFND